MAATQSQAVGAPLPNAPVGPPQGQVVPFRSATTERVQLLPFENSVTQTANENPIQRTVEGSGYIYGIMLRVVATTASNAATVAFAEDAPFSALSSVVFEDVNGQLVNLSGYNLYVANLVNGDYAIRFLDQSTDTNIFQQVTGSGGTGGSFTFMLRSPVATNRRDLKAALGNQDRAQKYQLRTNLAGSGSVYTTAPTTLPNITIEKYYENYSVPLPISPTGAQQQIVPDSFGTIRYITATVADAAPLGGSTINHYLRRIGNTTRWIGLVFRSNGSRSTAQSNFPTNIQVKVGEDILFNESYIYQRARMYENYGFDFPNGVLIFDRLRDFTAKSGWEVGDDYWHTQALVNAQLIITYPSGFGSTNNSLNIITDDLQYVQPSAGVAVSA